MRLRIKQGLARRAKPKKSPTKKPGSAAFKPYMRSPEVQYAVSLAARIIQNNLEKAKALAVSVLEAVNAHKGANAVEKALKAKPFVGDHYLVSKISQLLDYGVESAAAFGATLLQAMGDNASAMKLLTTVLQTYPDLLD